MDGLLRQSALDQAELIRRREISCGELLELYLDRIARLDPELCSIVQRLDGPARRAARRLDRRGGGDAVFRGVPIGIKDCDPVFGTFTRVGSRAFKYAWTPFDSPAVRRLRRAGFVLAAKTSTSELTLLPFVEPAIHPPTRNPWDSRRTSGGSSGGSATAVAAGLLPIAHASDGGGSIRIPASFCHLFGHKHSRGFLPNFAGRLDPLRLAAVAAVSHSVEDVAAVLDVLAGRSDVLPREGSLRSAVRRPPPVGLRVRLCVASSLVEVDPEVAAAVRAVGRLLQERGDHVEEGAALGVDLQAYLPVYQRFAAGIPVVRESLLEPLAGNQALQMTLPPATEERGAGLLGAVDPELDVMFLRWYAKLDTSFDIVGSSHNGGGISAHYNIGFMATPGIPADGMNKFLVEYECWRGVASEPNPGNLNIYVYHPEQRDNYGDHFFPDGVVLPNTSLPGNFGPDFIPRPNVTPELGRWYAHEVMVRANTPGERDGRIALWLDGNLIADFQNIRLRDVSTLTIDRFDVSHHARENRGAETHKWVDNVVAAHTYIGPMFMR